MGIRRGEHVEVVKAVFGAHMGIFVTAEGKT